ncbi:sugar phosphate nucleotidyltransferase [Geobacillus stearothermophilus]|uniref:sugar phosphate nucleotidyltransferase n=1 Tax=Geobacillus stearothermophilus TaxID=1422 RepID=UPI002E239C9F|nr:sugar phosphate nucleotidyltransferase [Geobacillus stearothermophilus]MED4269192.1 sugar phosphate nucleotidyltransferase [Geobacillus stearothermophilus]
MKGIILAGGTGSRLYPLTKVTNKHLLPVGKYPMIYHAIHKLKEAGMSDILIVTGREHMGDVVNLLGSGSEFGVQFTYKVQDQAGGIAQALGLCEAFVGNDLMTVILGDNVFSDSIAPYVENFKRQQTGAKILIKGVSDPERFGVPELEGERIKNIEEKPKTPKSSYAVTGIYMYDATVFDIIRTLKPSARGELEITDVNNAYIARNELTYDVLKGWWTDAGTYASYLRANELAKDIDFGEWFNKNLNH